MKVIYKKLLDIVYNKNNINNNIKHKYKCNKHKNGKVCKHGLDKFFHFLILIVSCEKNYILYFITYFLCSLMSLIVENQTTN